MGGIRGRVGASEGIGVLLLLASDLSAGFWGPASSSCSPIRLAGGLLQRFCLAQDPGAIGIKI